MSESIHLDLSEKNSNNQENVQLQFFTLSMASEVQNTDLDFQPKVEIEENLCRFCQQICGDGVKIFSDSISSLLPYLPVYVSPSDPAVLSSSICITCVKKMNIVKDFFSLIYHSYKNVLQDVDLFFKFDMITITREIDASDVQVKLQEDQGHDLGQEKADHFENAAEYVKVEQLEHSDTNSDDEFTAKEITPVSIDSKPKKIKIPKIEKKVDGPQKQFKDGKIVILRKRSKRKYVRIETLSTLCTCTECGRQFSSQEENIHHWDVEHTGKTTIYKCNEDEGGCNFFSSNSLETKTHLKQHMLELGFIKECDICKKLIKNLYFSRHYEMHLTEGITYQCDLCEAVFKHKVSLESHRKAHLVKKEKNHQCDLCDKKFHTKGQLKSHTNSVHKQLREHKCDQCDKQFSTSNNLTKHIALIHNNERHICDECGASYASKVGLRHHINGVHKKVFQFSCSLCDAKFNRKTLLQLHMNKHTGSKPYTCSTCGKCFARPNILKDHEITHLPEEQRNKHFGCKICGKTMAGNGSLWNHYKMVHKDIDIKAFINAAKSDVIVPKFDTFTWPNIFKQNNEEHS